MPQEDTGTYVASFRNRSLRTWETESGYMWQVTDSDAGEIIAEGEAASREDAMITAAGAAGADWGSAKWRRPGEEDEE